MLISDIFCNFVGELLYAYTQTKKINMITKYQIEMLNVKDADAFIVYYETNDGKKHLVLIDAGRYGNGMDVIRHLNYYYRNIPVELAIVTHPDDDHFGGFIYMLELLKGHKRDAVEIQHFWVNDPREHFTTRDIEEDISAEELDKRLGGVYRTDDKMLLEMIDELGIRRQEVFATTQLVYCGQEENGDEIYHKAAVFSDMEGFVILGPNLPYFEVESTTFRYDKKLNFIEETTEEQDVEDDEEDERLKEHLSYVLDEADRDPSSHNRSSLIVLFQPSDGLKYLFTGDSSTDSFEAMDQIYKDMCENVFWLKVPHHGSKANLNTKWIKHFNPKNAYISTLRRGKYLNQCTINALKKISCAVVSTHMNPTSAYIVRHNFLERKLKEVIYC